MLKLVSGAIIVGVCSYFGWLMAQAYVERLKQLRALRVALQMLETEIGYALTPLPEALARIAQHTEKEISQFFQQVRELILSGNGYTAGEAWNMALDQVYAQTALHPVDREIIGALGVAVGASDREDQLKHLHLACEQLQKEEINAAEMRAKHEKMWKYAGFLTGLVIVLLLI